MNEDGKQQSGGVPMPSSLDTVILKCCELALAWLSQGNITLNGTGRAGQAAPCAHCV